MKKLLCLILVMILVATAFSGCKATEVRGEISSGEETEFGIGKAEGNTYKNDFLGLSCTLPEEWSFYSDAQIAELNGVAQEYVDKDVAEALKNAQIIYDMYASNSIDFSSVNINLEKLSGAQTVAMSVKEALEGQLLAIKASFGNMGYENVSVEYATVTVDGKTFDGIELSAEIDGTDFYEKIFSFKKGGYMANVTIAVLGEDKTEEILKYFSVE